MAVHIHLYYSTYGRSFLGVERGSGKDFTPALSVASYGEGEEKRKRGAWRPRSSRSRLPRGTRPTRVYRRPNSCSRRAELRWTIVGRP